MILILSSKQLAELRFSNQIPISHELSRTLTDSARQRLSFVCSYLSSVSGSKSVLEAQFELHLKLLLQLLVGPLVFGLEAGQVAPLVTLGVWHEHSLITH